MVHWKRDLDLYTIGRPLERNAGFWLDYMKGLNGDHSDAPSRRSVPAPAAERIPTRSQPRHADATPMDKDPFFNSPTVDPLDLATAQPLHSDLLEDAREMMDRARRRVRQRHADAERRAFDF